MNLDLTTLVELGHCVTLGLLTASYWLDSSRRLDKHQAVKIGRLNSGNSFVGKREKSLYSETADI